jgi:hypothetical protein
VEPTDAPHPEIAPGGDFELVALVLASGLFVSLFLPWVETISGWALRVGEEAGVLALALVLVELLRLTGSWTSRGAQLSAACLTAAAGIMSVTTFVTLRWGSGGPLKFSALRYGAWIGFALGILLVVVAIAQLSAARQASS